MRLFLPTYLHEWLTQRLRDDADSVSGHVGILNDFFCTQLHQGLHVAHPGAKVSWCSVKVYGVHSTSVVAIPQGWRAGHDDDRARDVKSSPTPSLCWSCKLKEIRHFSMLITYSAFFLLSF